MADQDTKELGRTWVIIAGFVGLVLLAGAYSVLRGSYPIGSLADHANLGNALAPVVAFLTLLTVVAALASVQIQRTELALQRQELRETRDEMKEQRKQFKRTAEAQEALAGSQALLAEAQINGNREAACLRLAQHSNTIAALDAALASLDAASMLAYAYKPANTSVQNNKLEARRQAIGNRIDRELKMEEALQVLLTHGGIHSPPIVIMKGPDNA